jgi:outer membrane biosynthesis protein TonB
VHDALAMTEGSIVVAASFGASGPPSLGVPEEAPDVPEEAPDEPEAPEVPEEAPDEPEEAPDEPEDVPVPSPEGASLAVLPPHATAAASAATANADTCFRTPEVLI